jgi:hypothetical protein
VSSEALERALAKLRQCAELGAPVPGGTTLLATARLDTQDCVALLAEVARLEQRERDQAGEIRDLAECVRVFRAQVARLEQERDEHAKRADENLDQGMAEYHRRVAAGRAEQSLKAMLAATVERAEKAERERDEQEGYPGIAHDFLTAQSDRAVLLKALAVAREREQRYREAAELALDAIAHCDGPCGTVHLGLRAALVDEPAAATLAEPGSAKPPLASGSPPDGLAVPPGSASAAADEPAHGFAGVAGQGSHSQRSSQAAPATSAPGHSPANDAAAPGLESPSQEDAAGSTAAGVGAAADEPGEIERLREALDLSERDARWIVGQYQRLRDEPLKEVAIAIVTRCEETRGGVPPSAADEPGETPA